MGRKIRFLVVILALPAAPILALDRSTDAALNLSDSRPVSAKEWNQDTKLWVARSCVGEAGFEALEECTAIAWVYAIRSREVGLPFLETVRRYSAAIKRHSLHQRPWLLELGLESRRPESWPRRLNWPYYRDAWMEMLATLDRWAAGEIPNLVPGANHFGSSQDAKRAFFQWRWKRLDAPKHFRNWFFDSTQRVPRKHLRQFGYLRRHRQAQSSE